MKIKHLPILTGLLLTTVMSSSCLRSNNNNFELGTDATIHSIKVDTVYGKEVALSIDQLQNKIFNIDSLPVHADTIVDKLLITEIVSGGAWITRKTADDKDTIFNYLTDSLDFSKPQKLTVYAMDYSIKREYTMSINVHKQDPDSLSWKKLIPSKNFNTSGRFMNVIEDELFVFNPDLTAYKTSSLNATNWEDLTITGLTEIKSIIGNTAKDKLYALDNGIVYVSQNGYEWSPISSQSTVTHLLAADKNRVMVIANDTNGDAKFAYIDAEEDGSLAEVVLGLEVPEKFDTSYISSTFYDRNNTAMLITKPSESQEFSNVWMSDNGLNWDLMLSKNDARKLPMLTNPQIVYYDNVVYAFGGDYSKFYRSINGLDWVEASEKFDLPKEFKDAGRNAFVVDSRNYMWLNFDLSNELWRGRLNKFSHKIQK